MYKARNYGEFELVWIETLEKQNWYSTNQMLKKW